MFLFNKFILGRVQASKPAVVSVLGNQDEDATTALLKLTLEPNVSEPSNDQAPILFTPGFMPAEPVTIAQAATISDLQASPSEVALVICIEEPNPTNNNAAGQTYSVIEGEPIAGPSVEPPAAVDRFDTVDGSEGNDVFGPPPSSAAQVSGNSATTEANALGTIDGSEGNDAFGYPSSVRLPFPTDFAPTAPVICWEGSYDPLLTVRQEYAAAMTDGSDAAMELFLARHPGVEVSPELGVIKNDIAVTMPNGQSEWSALS
jgi:hypothetical protein